MQAHAYYLQLCSAYEHGLNGTPVSVTLEELAENLYCTPRNAKILLKKMADSGWLRWVPGRGRGNVSKLTFLMPRELIVMEAAVDAAIKGDLEEAFALIHGDAQSKKLTDAFVTWLFKHFGYKEIQADEKQLATLHIPLKKPVVTLDPAYSFYAVDSHLVRQLFDTLVLYDSASRIYEPKLAHHWEHNADCTIWIFHLRKGVRFHNGREMTADDVKFTFDRLADPAAHSPHRWLVEHVAETVAVDRYVVEVRLKRPHYAFLRLLQSTGASILPKEVYDGADESQTQAMLPVGTGAFRMERNNGYIIRLRAFDDYYGYRPHLDLIEMWVLPEQYDDYGFSSIVWGEVACDRRGAKIPFPLTGSMPREDELYSGSWTNTESAIFGCGLLTFNLNKPGPMQDERFRHAIDLLIGREEMIRKLGGNRTAPARGFIPNVNYVDVAPFNADEAQKLLEQCGYAGEPLKLFTYSHHIEDAEWIRSQCGLAGVRIDVCPAPEKEMTENRAICEADLILYQLVVEDDLIYLIETLKMFNSYVRAHLNPELEKLVDDRIDELWAVEDEEEGRLRFTKLIEELQRRRTFLFLLHKSWRTAYSPSVKGVVFNSFGWIDFKQVWFTHHTGGGRLEKEG
jgi:SgrR family transcriptional regulator